MSTKIETTDTFSYTLRKHPRAKYMRITIRHDASVLVTVPRYCSYKAGKEFVAEKKQWIEKRLQEYGSAPRSVLAHGSEKEYKEYKEVARQLVMKRLVELNRHYGFSYSRVSIRNQRSRWGSCSENGNLNFNYRIVFLHPELQDYIMVHELCHLQELNHSPRFWQLVAKAIPNYKLLAKQVRSL